MQEEVSGQRVFNIFHWTEWFFKEIVKWNLLNTHRSELLEKVMGVSPSNALKFLKALVKNEDCMDLNLENKEQQDNIYIGMSFDIIIL